MEISRCTFLCFIYLILGHVDYLIFIPFGNLQMHLLGLVVLSFMNLSNIYIIIYKLLANKRYLKEPVKIDQLIYLIINMHLAFGV